MGDRSNINIIQSKLDGTNPLYLGVSAYNHHGGIMAQMNALRAIAHGLVRLNDPSYGTKTIIGHFLKGQMEDETGGGVHPFAHEKLTSAYTEEEDNEHGYLVIDFVNEEIVLYDYEGRTGPGRKDKQKFMFSTEGAKGAWHRLRDHLSDPYRDYVTPL